MVSITLLVSWKLLDSKAVLVQGPHLIRSAKIVGSVIRLKGDSAQANPIEVFASKKVQTIFWNDKELKTSKTSYGSLQASLPQPPIIKLPSLGPWKYNDSLPEKAQNYKDTGAAWICKLSYHNIRVMTRPYR